MAMLEVGVVIVGGVIIYPLFVGNHATMRILSVQYGVCF